MRRFLSSAKACIECKDILKNKFHCIKCDKLQPHLPKGQYTEILIGTETFDIDQKELRKRFLKYQEMVHPDKIRNKSDKALSEDHSAWLNKAYSTLKDPFMRALYLLKQRGCVLDQESLTDSEFLEVILEIREELNEQSNNQHRIDLIRQENQEKILELKEKIKILLAQKSLNKEKARELMIQWRYRKTVEEAIES